MNAGIQLGEICDIRSGGTPLRSEKKYYGGGIPWAKIGDLFADGPILKTEETITEEGLKAIRGRIFPSGTLLFAIYGSMGKMGFAGTDLATNQAILGITPKHENRVCLRYLYHYLESRIQEFQEAGRGVTQKNLSAKFLRELVVPLPNFQEQRRIATILDKADRIRHKREQALTPVAKLLQATFLEMFGDPVTNPRRWKEGAIGDCLCQVIAGWSAKGEARPAGPQEMGVLKISAVTSGEYLPSENKFVSSIPTGKSLVIPKPGDLLFSRANTRELVAATCIVSDAPKNVFLPDKLWRLEVNTAVAQAPYLKLVLAHPEFRRILCARATGTSGSMLNISKRKLLEHPIPIPPVVHQKKFSNLWYSVKQVEVKMRAHLRDAGDLCGSLAQRAFRDEL